MFRLPLEVGNATLLLGGHMVLRDSTTQTEAAVHKLSGTVFFQSLTLIILANKEEHSSRVIFFSRQK